jgi:hypothetical protein
MTMSRKTFAAVVVALCALARMSLAQQPAPAAPAAGPTGVIAGRLTSVDSNQPVRKAQVRLSAPASRLTRTTTSDPEGRFSFESLPPGEYTVVASKPGYLDMVFGARTPGSSSPGTPLTLAQGQKIEKVDLRMRLGSVISGVVIDEFGDPAYNTPVRALRFIYENGYRNLTLGGSGTTDDRGVYRIAGLMPGEYLVSAVPRDTVSASAAQAEAIRDRQAQMTAAAKAAGTEPPMMTPAPTGTTGYVPVYFPGTTLASSAAPVRVGLSEEVPRIDLRLQVIQTASITGRITSSEAVLPQTRLQLLDASMPVNNVGIWFRDMRADGTFGFHGLVPGPYILKGHGTPGGKPGMAGGEMWGRVDVAVDARGAANVMLPMQRGVTVSATLVADSLPAGFDPARLRVSLSPITSPTDWEMGAPTLSRDAGGRLVVQHVEPGQYQMRVAGLPDGWSLASAMFEEKDTADYNLLIDGSRDITGVALKFASRAGEVTGALTNTSGKPVSDHAVILFPSDRRLWVPQSRRIRTSQPGADGRYTFRHLPAGDYHVVAIRDPEPGRHFDADYLGQLVPLSIGLKLGEGERRTLDIRIK